MEGGDLAVLVLLDGEEGGFEEGDQEGEVWTGFEEVFEGGFGEVVGDSLEEVGGEVEELHYYYYYYY